MSTRWCRRGNHMCVGYNEGKACTLWGEVQVHYSKCCSWQVSLLREGEKWSEGECKRSAAVY